VRLNATDPLSDEATENVVGNENAAQTNSEQRKCIGGSSRIFTPAFLCLIFFSDIFYPCNFLPYFAFSHFFRPALVVPMPHFPFPHFSSRIFVPHFSVPHFPPYNFVQLFSLAFSFPTLSTSRIISVP